MCEIAISSYKQIGGNKCARLVGKLGAGENETDDFAFLKVII